MLKLACFLRNLQTLQVNNSRIIQIKNREFSGSCFYMNTDLQICIRCIFKERELERVPVLSRRFLHLKFVKDTLMQHSISCDYECRFENLQIFSSSYENNILKISQ